MDQQIPMDDEVDENNPAFKNAVAFAMKALYENKAAKDMAKALKAAPDKVQAFADTAYEVTGISFERSGADVPDELLGLLLMVVMGEVGEIAEAAGIELSGADVASAFKKCILRFLSEQGVDAGQLQQAMDAVDVNAFDQEVA